MKSLFQTPEPCFDLPEDPAWRQLISDFHQSRTGQALMQKMQQAIQAGDEIYPTRVYRAFNETALNRVRVVILGQDPYHGEGQAEGLAFSVPSGVKVPPSLRNIKKELARDLDIPITKNGSLVSWSRQGVLLFNAIMTVKKATPASHRGWGWEELTDAVIGKISKESQGTVFLLWGKFAESKRPLIDETRHLVLTSNHPSPLSAMRPPKPFIGCGHFSQTNRWLEAKGFPAIDWTC